MSALSSARICAPAAAAGVGESDPACGRHCFKKVVLKENEIVGWKLISMARQFCQFKHRLWRTSYVVEHVLRRYKVLSSNLTNTKYK